MQTLVETVLSLQATVADQAQLVRTLSEKQVELVQTLAQTREDLTLQRETANGGSAPANGGSANRTSFTTEPTQTSAPLSSVEVDVQMRKPQSGSVHIKKPKLAGKQSSFVVVPKLASQPSAFGVVLRNNAASALHDLTNTGIRGPNHGNALTIDTKVRHLHEA